MTQIMTYVGRIAVYLPAGAGRGKTC